ncbi:MAG: elongation factor P [Candidatus Firestonebacteria bacterium RifOxyC12_full_39_7]|nr:MAG: elongation factor P [Candidatus Firestonebacteria bacterium RifOxyC12_full_39_7]
MIDSSDLKRGVLLDLDGVIFEVVDYSRHKPGKGATNIKTRIRNVKLDTTIEKTFDASIKLKLADVEQKDMQFLYKDGGNYVFMDTESFEQQFFTPAALGSSVKFLKENMVIYALLHKGEPIGVQLPNAVDLKIVETVPGIKGDTVTGGSKPATLETGAVVQVPLFVLEGETVKIDTRTGEYLERVQK